MFSYRIFFSKWNFNIITYDLYRKLDSRSHFLAKRNFDCIHFSSLPTRLLAGKFLKTKINNELPTQIHAGSIYKRFQL